MKLILNSSSQRNHRELLMEYGSKADEVTVLSPFLAPDAGAILGDPALRHLRRFRLFTALEPRSPFQINVVRGAEQLAAPLTIVSDLPVFVVGSLNTARQTAWRGPPPLMIDAPRITLLPDEADVQLGLAPGTFGWASVWDLVPPAGSTTPSALPLVATSNVTLYAVLRTRVCGRPGGVYQGGAVDQAPAVLGDWADAEVRVVGAVEQSEETGLTAAQCQWWGSGYGTAADRSAWRVPGSRTLLYDPRLQHPGFVIPGSFLPANLPVGGVPGAALRDGTRQARATGGYGILRITQMTGRREPRAAVPVAGLPPLPPAPPPLPR